MAPDDQEMNAVKSQVNNIENTVGNISQDIREIREMAHSFAKEVREAISTLVGMQTEIKNLTERVNKRDAHCEKYNPEFIAVQQQVSWHNKLLMILGTTTIGAIAAALYKLILK